MLKIMIILPIISIIIKKYVKNIFLFTTILELYLTIYLYLIINNNNIEMKWRELLFFNIELTIDSISLGLILLTNIIFPIILLIREKEYNKKEEDIFNILIMILLSCLEGIFMMNDILNFYILFELILIPIFLLIIRYGSRYKKIEGAYKIFIYTIIGSLLFIISIIIIYENIKTTNYNYIYYILNTYSINYYIKLFIYLLIMISFMIKIPMFPFHIWLPIAHSESPTTGSVILASILLKIGTYGIIKYNIGLITEINEKISGIIITMGVISILYSSIIIFNIIDIKKIIAYSSIIHMNYMIIALYSLNIEGKIGGYYSSITHGIISSSLFILVGILYRRYHSRIILYFKGLSNLIPIFSIFWILFIFSNISLPITSGFVGEILSIIGAYKKIIIITIILLILLVLNTGYNILMLNKMVFGNPSIYIYKYKDMTLNEILTIIPLIIINITLGIWTEPLINMIYIGIYNI